VESRKRPSNVNRWPNQQAFWPVGPEIRVPISSLKGEVKKKHNSNGWSFSCFAAHLVEQGLFWPSAPCARLLGVATPRLGFSLPAVFIASWQRSLLVPKPAKQNVG